MKEMSIGKRTGAPLKRVKPIVNQMKAPAMPVAKKMWSRKPMGRAASKGR